MNETKERSFTQKAVDVLAEKSAKATISTANAVGRLMTKRCGKMLAAIPLALSMTAITVCAADGAGGDAEGTIQSIIDILKKWIPRLGGMLIVVGGIQLGIGFKDDDATGKTRGMQCMIGGAIVAAIGGAVNF